jgi:hypothetical protein
LSKRLQALASDSSWISVRTPGPLAQLSSLVSAPPLRVVTLTSSLSVSESLANFLQIGVCLLSVLSICCSSVHRPR